MISINNNDARRHSWKQYCSGKDSVWSGAFIASRLEEIMRFHYGSQKTSKVWESIYTPDSRSPKLQEFLFWISASLAGWKRSNRGHFFLIINRTILRIFIQKWLLIFCAKKFLEITTWLVKPCRTFSALLLLQMILYFSFLPF